MAHHGDNIAVGFMAIGEVTIERPDGDPAHGLLISGLAVHESIQNVTVIRALLRRVVAVRNEKLKSKRYEFEAAMVSDNERIATVLQRAGFHRHENAFWIRPIEPR